MPVSRIVADIRYIQLYDPVIDRPSEHAHAKRRKHIGEYGEYVYLHAVTCAA
jgi:hypothetical protein